MLLARAMFGEWRSYSEPGRMLRRLIRTVRPPSWGRWRTGMRRWCGFFWKKEPRFMLETRGEERLWISARIPSFGDSFAMPEARKRGKMPR